MVEGGPVFIDIRAMELLFSRLCHDLANPVGAVNNGIEMIEEFDQSMLSEAMPLIGDSARQAAARLKFYRTAYGLAGTRSMESMGEIRQLGEALLAGGRATLRWPDTGGGLKLGAGWGKLLLNMIPLSAEALPRGGVLAFDVEAAGQGFEITVSARGKDARFQPECRDALAVDAAADALTSVNIHAFFVARLAHQLNCRIDVDSGAADCITFTLTPLDGV